MGTEDVKKGSAAKATFNILRQVITELKNYVSGLNIGQNS